MFQKVRRYRRESEFTELEELTADVGIVFENYISFLTLKQLLCDLSLERELSKQPLLVQSYSSDKYN